MHIYHESDVKTAVLECVLDRYHSVPAEEEIVHAFSKKFEEWAQKLIRRIADKQSAVSARFSGRGLKIAIIIAVLIALLATTVLAIPAIREAIVNFVLQDMGGYYIIAFDPEKSATAPLIAATHWVPTAIPEGFDIVVDEKNDCGVVMWWCNEKDEWICYCQDLIPRDPDNNRGFGTDSDRSTHSSLVVQGYQVEMTQNDEVYTVMWTDNSYFYWIEFSNSIDFSVFESMLASMTPVEE